MFGVYILICGCVFLVYFLFCFVICFLAIILFIISVFSDRLTIHINLLRLILADIVHECVCDSDIRLWYMKPLINVKVSAHGKKVDILFYAVVFFINFDDMAWKS
jgi:hypothetical protein